MSRYKVQHWGPNGETRIFTDPFDIPKDWTPYPPEEAPQSAEEAPAAPEPAKAGKTPPAARKSKRKRK